MEKNKQGCGREKKRFSITCPKLRHWMPLRLVSMTLDVWCHKTLVQWFQIWGPFVHFHKPDLYLGKQSWKPVLLHWGLCYQSGCDVWLRALFRQSCLLQLRDITKVKTVLIPSRPWKSSILSTHHIWACKSLCVSLSQKSPNSKRQSHIAPIHVTPNSLSVIVDLILYFPQLPL